MLQSPDDFIVTAPAFVTLFGEHHRHLGFGSIVMATSLRMAIRATARDDGLVFVGGFGGEGVCFNPGETPDFPETEIIPGACLSHLSFDVHPGHGYSFRALNTGVERSGLDIRHLEAVSWSAAILRAFDESVEQNDSEVALLAQRTFKTVADSGNEGYCKVPLAGGLLAFPPHADEPLNVNHEMEGIVIGFDEEATDAESDLRRSQEILETALNDLREREPNFDFASAETDAIYGDLKYLSDDQATRLFGYTDIRDVWIEAVAAFEAEKLDIHEIGRLLDQQHDVYRDYFGLSSSKLEKLVDAAKKAGALGCSICGTGGTFVAFAPARQKQVAKAIEREGGMAISVEQDEGLRIQSPEEYSIP